MFWGQYTAKVDDKGRVSFPARFREALARTDSDHLFLVPFKSEGHPCLEVYPPAIWQKFNAELKERAQGSADIIKYLQNRFLPSVQECPVDRQGRILLSADSRSAAELGHDVVFVGLDEKLRVWSADHWAAVRSESPDLSEHPAVVALIG